MEDVYKRQFRTFADKPEVDYSQKEQKHPITKAVLAPMKAVKKMLVSIELHLDASIDKLDNLAMNLQLDKEKRMVNIQSPLPLAQFLSSTAPSVPATLHSPYASPYQAAHS